MPAQANRFFFFSVSFILFLHPSKHFQNQNKAHFASFAGNWTYTGVPLGWVQQRVTMDRGAGANQLDDGERRDAGRQDKMCSKAVHLAPSLGGTRQKQELNVFCAYLYRHMHFR